MAPEGAKALAPPLFFLPRSSVCHLVAPVLAAWNLIACENIKEAPWTLEVHVHIHEYAHTYTQACEHAHTLRYVGAHIHTLRYVNTHTLGYVNTHIMGPP